MHQILSPNLHLRRLIGPLLGFGLFIYFLFHLMHGDRGFVSMQEVEANIRQAEAHLTVVSAERKELEHRVNLLRPGSLDPDMLEERARAVLGYSHPDDLVIIEN